MGNTEYRTVGLAQGDSTSPENFNRSFNSLISLIDRIQWILNSRQGVTIEVIYSYTDDVAVLTYNAQIAKKVINEFDIWCGKNNMSLNYNYKKCGTMFI